MDKVKINHIPAFVVVRPEHIGERVVRKPSLKELIIHRIQYLMVFHIPVAFIWAIWIGLVIWGGEYIASR